MRNIDNFTQIDVVTAFVNELKLLSNAESCLKLEVSNCPVFDTTDHDVQVARGFNWVSGISSGSKFDLICGDLPLAVKPNMDIEFGGYKLKIRRNWIEIINAVKLLKNDGLGIFLVEPSAFSSNEGQRVEKALNTEGCFINAIFNAPQGLLAPQTAITPVFIVITHNEPSSIFVAELLNESQSRNVASNYISSLDDGNLEAGTTIPTKSFHSFHRIKVKNQIEKLETQYKEYEEYKLGELAVEINYVRSGENLKEKPNSIYIPKTGNSPVISEIEKATIKHHNYFQVVLNDRVFNGYVAAFFKSDIGRLILDSLTSGTFISHLNRKELELAPIALPTLDDQTKILRTQDKLQKLMGAIDLFDAELALNPNNSDSVLGQLDGMLEAIGKLTDIDKVLGIIRQGESKVIEYKETLSLDVRKKTKERYIELSVLKTVVAFLNTEGGILLVGVNDGGDITGVDGEIDKFYKNLDKFLLHFKNLIKVRIGEEYYPFIEYRPIRVEKKYILLVECKESQSPCYLDNAEFYVRTNPATDKLEGPKLVEYVKNHFNQ